LTGGRNAESPDNYKGKKKRGDFRGEQITLLVNFLLPLPPRWRFLLLRRRAAKA